MNEHAKLNRVPHSRVIVVAIIGLVVLLSDIRALEGIFVAAFLIALVGGFLVVRAVFRRLTSPVIELTALDLLIASAIWRWHDRRKLRRLGSVHAHDSQG